MTTLETYQTRITNLLNQHLPPDDSRLTQAMRYATFGGKHLRAALIYATANSFSLSLEHVDYAAIAIEAIHAYSLIHDDLPAMDNDDLRRGKPSCHKAFGETEAILAGDALNTFAFSILARAPLPATTTLAQIRILADAAGWSGMVGGQSLDMTYTNQKTNLETLQTIHRNKTGALITAAFHLGAIPATDYPQYRRLLEQLGNTIGIAYQIIDDILDATQDTKTLGKTAGKDATQHKNTYISHLGLNGARAWINEIEQQYQTLLKQLPNPAPLQTICTLLFNRNH